HVRRVSLELPGKSENAWQGIKNNIPRIWRLRRFLRQEKSDVIISFMDRQNVMTLIATFGSPIPVIISERVDPRHEKINFYWNLARRLVYRFADALVIQAENIRPWTKGIISPDKVFIIPNPIPFAAVERNPAPEKKVISMGRLVYQKGFDLLIEAFARCAPFFPEWELTILGEGPERENLTQLISSLGLQEKVHLPGLAMNPLQDLQKASLFVLSSRWEGFPNALLEAMACGLPVISFDCPSGPGEIIRHEVDGLLIPPQDVGALAEAMKRLMHDPELREKLAERGQKVTHRFDLDTIMQQWEALF
ncbi:MAG: glycosyltransferase family 4 protein, partial [Anaerolineae bacterium]|nr:glycosyltransferase family 4 protein [Anaerolineae bacterium]